MTLSEYAYLQSLGQTPPTDVSYEGPDSYVDPAEQATMFPKGLPAANKGGGLAQQSALSRLAQAIAAPPASSTTPTTAQVTQGGQQELNQVPQTSAAMPRMNPVHRQEDTTDPAAVGAGERSMRQTAATSSLANSLGKIVKMVAAGYAGGAAAGGGGAGAGASSADYGAGASIGAEGGGAAGGAAMEGAGSGATGLSASGAAGMGGGGGWQGILQQYMNGKGGSGGSGMFGGGGGGGGMGGMMSMGGGSKQPALNNYIVNMLGGRAAKTQAALAETGALGGLTDTSGQYWLG